ncbi:PhoU domain-containing protein [Halobellus sp. EA9]|uniref:PhoU domain-containing protein n=1 Tax=Halobellus sp. EA9 TaxID=3421647 RepID=UPI003EB80636
METRKIQKVSGGTFTVSLPREWAQAEGISQGDVVDLHTHLDGVLVVQTRDREVDPTGEVTVELRGADPDCVRQSLWAAYTAGYTDITLTARDAFDSSQRTAANEAVGVLSGATVTSATDGEISIRVFLDSEEISVPQLVRQLSFLTTSMHEEAMAAVADDTTTHDLGDRDDQADRLFALTERSFVLALSRLSEVDSLGSTRPELFDLWSTARNLERVADHAERVGRIAREADQIPASDRVSELRRLAERSRNIVGDAVSGIVDDVGTERVRGALQRRARVREEIAELDRRLFRDATGEYRLARILYSIQRTAEHGGNIAELGLQRAIRRGDGISLDWGGDTVGRLDRPDANPSAED